VFRRQHSLRCFFHNIVDVFFTAREELRQFPFATLAGGITEDRPQRVGLSPLLPDPMLFFQILVGVYSVDLTGMSRRFRGCPWVSRDGEPTRSSGSRTGRAHGGHRQLAGRSRSTALTDLAPDVARRVLMTASGRDCEHLRWSRTGARFCCKPTARFSQHAQRPADRRAAITGGSWMVKSRQLRPTTPCGSARLCRGRLAMRPDLAYPRGGRCTASGDASGWMRRRIDFRCYSPRGTR